MRARLGIDCGGTNTKLLLATASDGRAVALHRTHFPTPHGDGALHQIAGRARSLTSGHDLESFAIAVPGIIDDDTGEVAASTNLRWLERLRPAASIETALGIPGRILHDGAAAAVAEVALGAGHGHSDVFVIALGTGVAGAHVVDGAVRRGSHGGAGEIGHVSQGPGLRCSCGQEGCLETFIGGTQLGARWAEAGGLASLADTLHAPTAKDLARAAEANNPAALMVWDQATTALAKGILGLVALIDPGLIVIGGGVARAGDLVLGPTVSKARELATFHRLPDIVPAALGMWAAAWGAILAAPGIPWKLTPGASPEE
jgi:glucokinase